MAKFKKFDTVGIIKGTGIVPVFYNADVELTKKVVKACYDGGIRAFEFTNRGDGAHRVFKEVISFVRAECPEMAFGAGTILDECAGFAGSMLRKATWRLPRPM